MTIDQAIRKALRTVAMYPDEGPLVVYKLGRGFDVYEVGSNHPRGADPICEVNPEEIRHVRAA